MNRLAILIGLVGFVVAVKAKGLTFALSKEKVKPQNNPLVMNDMFGEKLNNHHDVIYKGVITVGTPPKKFNVVFDTGSGLFWLPAAGCASSGPHAQACANSSMTYNPQESSTSNEMHQSFSMHYGTGTSSGQLYTDTLRIGDPDQGKQLEMLKVPVGAASKIQYIDHGIIGLSLKDRKNPTPVFMQAVNEGKMDQPIFTTFMKKCDGACEDGGSLTLGGFDDKNCQEPIHWAPVVTGTSMWRFKLSGVAVGNYTNQNVDKFAITDTGTSYIMMPTAIFTEVVAELKAEKRDSFYLLPCDSKFSLEFTVNGKKFPVTEKEVLLNQGFGDKCVVAIGDAGIFDMFLLGDAFIRGHCQVYDVKEKRVGFAAVKLAPKDLKPSVDNKPVPSEEDKKSVEGDKKSVEGDKKPLDEKKSVEDDKKPSSDKDDKKPANKNRRRNNRRGRARANANKTRNNSQRKPAAHRARA